MWNLAAKARTLPSQHFATSLLKRSWIEERFSPLLHRASSLTRRRAQSPHFSAQARRNRRTQRRLVERLAQYSLRTLTYHIGPTPSSLRDNFTYTLTQHYNCPCSQVLAEAIALVSGFDYHYVTSEWRNRDALVSRDVAMTPSLPTLLATLLCVCVTSGERVWSVQFLLSVFFLNLNVSF